MLTDLLWKNYFPQYSTFFFLVALVFQSVQSFLKSDIKDSVPILNFFIIP